MKNPLLNLKLKNTQDIESITKAMLFHDGQPYATSNKIAKYFGINHKDLLKKIREFHTFEAMIRGGKLRHQFRTVKGREYTYFELDADAFSFICLSITGKKAEAFKWAFIDAFKKATAEAITARVSINVNYSNEVWIEARNHGKDIRKLLTDKVKEFCEYAEEQRGGAYPTCPFYKHITDVIYAHVGVTAPKAGKNPRDVYSGDIIEAIEDAERIAIQLLDEVMANGGSRKIKNLLKERLQSELQDEVAS